MLYRARLLGRWHGLVTGSPYSDPGLHAIWFISCCQCDCQICANEFEFALAYGGEGTRRNAFEPSARLRPRHSLLVVRRVGRESEVTMPAGELAALTSALHAMFAVHVRADHMAAARNCVALPPAGVALVLPTELHLRPATEAAP